MSSSDRGASASTAARRRAAAAAFYSLNPGIAKSLYSGAAGQENSVKVAGLLVQPCCVPAVPVPAFYTVTYDANGGTGSVVDSLSPYAAGSAVTVLGPGTLVRSGYLFTGWNTAADGSGIAYAAGSTFVVGGATTLYAQWTLITYTVTYNSNGATGGSVPVDPSSPYIPASTVTVLGPGTLVRSGYAFAVWTTAADGSGSSYSVNNTFTVLANTVLYARWVGPGTVTYIGNGNTGGTAPVDTFSPYVPSSPVTVMGASTLLKPGYTFVRWTTVADGSGTSYAPASTFTMGFTPVVLYAQWALITYTVTYNANGGTGSQTDSLSPYAAGATVTVLGPGTIVRSGFVFNGWNSNPTGTGTAYAAGATFTILNNTTLFAKWYAS